MKREWEKLSEGGGGNIIVPTGSIREGGVLEAQDEEIFRGGICGLTGGGAEKRREVISAVGGRRRFLDGRSVQTMEEVRPQ